jgi:alpha-L-arabinofuranosidase
MIIAETSMKQKMKITIDPDARTRVYSPMIFGGFLEHFGRQIYGGVFDPGSPLSNSSGFRKDVIEALKELKVPIIRWPGGCYVSGYHWQDGVGQERTPTDDMAWGVVEPHSFGTDEFVELCRLLECEPYICNNAGNGTVEEMRGWVEYCRGKETFNVDTWSIGNENWGEHEIGCKPIEEWAPLVVEAAIQMKAADPGIRLAAASLPVREWALPLLQTAGDYLDYISIHGYWLGLYQENKIPDYLTCIMESEGPEEIISKVISSLDESGHRGRVKIAFDEWNLRGWYHPGFPRKEVQDYSDPEVARLVAARKDNLIPSQYTMADALFTASFLNACLRHSDDVGMANMAPIVNTRGPLYVHPEGIVRRAHFHTLAMYANILEDRVLEARVEADALSYDDRSVAVGDAIVTVDSVNQSNAIALVNRHPSNELECEVVTDGSTLDGSFSGTFLSGDSTDSFNDIQFPDKIRPVETMIDFSGGITIMPPHSLTIVRIRQGV